VGGGGVGFGGWESWAGLLLTMSFLHQRPNRRPSSSEPHLGLVVGGCGEHLPLLGGDGGVAVDHAREHAPQRLNAQRQRGHVQQQNVLHVTAQHTALDGRTHGHHLIGVDTAGGIALEHVFDDLVDLVQWGGPKSGGWSEAAVAVACCTAP